VPGPTAPTAAAITREAALDGPKKGSTLPKTKVGAQRLPFPEGHSAGHSVLETSAGSGDEQRAEHRRSSAPDSTAPRLMSYKQAADYLGVSYWTIRAWADAGKLPIVKLPGLRLLRVERAELDRFVDACRVA